MTKSAQLVSSQAAAVEYDRATLALMAAWVVAMAAAFAVLFIGEVMGQTPCNLCWLQRIAMFPLALVLGIASFRGDVSVWRYALPLAGGGALVAGFHTLLYYGLLPASIEPCGAGPSCTSADMLLVDVPLPVLSLMAFLVIAFCLAIVARRPS